MSGLNFDEFIIDHTITVSDVYDIKKDSVRKNNIGSYYFNFLLEDKDSHDKSYLLSRGFYPDMQQYLYEEGNNPLYWIQVRSTRINIPLCSLERNNTYNRFYKGGFSIERVYFKDLKNHIPSMQTVFNQYKKLKEIDEDLNFKKLDLFSNIILFVAYDKDKNPYAYNLGFLYDSSLVLSFNFQINNDKYYSVGSVLRSEVRKWCVDNGIEYYYIGDGYEDWGIYKSSESRGFEWWNGKDWITDVDSYVSLCNKDLKMKD